MNESRRIQTRSRARAFSLIELVIVVVILGIIGAVAIPRFSRGATGTQEKALIVDLQRIRAAVDLYSAEHGGAFPPSAAHLLFLSNARNNLDTGTGRAGGFIYGPYLRDAPPLPVGTKKGIRAMEVTADPSDTAPPGSNANASWWYNSSLGLVRVNLPDGEVDSVGVPYNQY